MTRELTTEELARVEGGVVAGPNGEGCTDPRPTDPKSSSYELLREMTGA